MKGVKGDFRKIQKYSDLGDPAGALLSIHNSVSKSISFSQLKDGAGRHSRSV